MNANEAVLQQIIGSSVNLEEVTVDMLDAKDEEKLLKPMMKDCSTTARAARRRVMLRAVAGEFVGTCLMFWTICGFLIHLKMLGVNITNPGTYYFASGVGSAFCAIPMIYAFSDISGAHFNPSITVATWVGGKTSNRKSVLFILAQILGALMAMVLLLMTFNSPPEGGPQNVIYYLVMEPADGVNVGYAFAMEFFSSMILNFVIWAVAFEDIESQQKATMTMKGFASARGLTLYAATPQTKVGFAPLAIGLLVAPLSMVGGDVSGAAFNPVRVFAPAVFTGKWTNHWVYWAGDIAGAIAGAYLRVIFSKFGKPESSPSSAPTEHKIMQKMFNRAVRNSIISSPTGRNSLGNRTDFPQPEGDNYHAMEDEQYDRADTQQPSSIN